MANSHYTPCLSDRGKESDEGERLLTARSCLQEGFFWRIRVEGDSSGNGAFPPQSPTEDYYVSDRPRVATSRDCYITASSTLRLRCGDDGFHWKYML